MTAKAALVEAFAAVGCLTHGVVIGSTPGAVVEAKATAKAADAWSVMPLYGSWGSTGVAMLESVAFATAQALRARSMLGRGGQWLSLIHI